MSVFLINGTKTTEHHEKNIYNLYLTHINSFQTEQAWMWSGKLQNSKLTQEKTQTLGTRWCFRNNTDFAIHERTNLVKGTRHWELCSLNDYTKARKKVNGRKYFQKTHLMDCYSKHKEFLKHDSKDTHDVFKSWTRDFKRLSHKIYDLDDEERKLQVILMSLENWKLKMTRCPYIC